MKAKEIRKMNSDDVMTLCESNNYYTEGTIKEWAEMLISCDEIENVKLAELQEIAENIFYHSEMSNATTVEEATVIIKLMMQQLVDKCCYTYIV